MAAGDRRARLREFLNTECIWTPNSSSTVYTKIYNATTALSPIFRLDHLGIAAGNEHHINVVVILLKPKSKCAYATIYINNKLVDCCVPEAVFIKKVPWQRKLFLIYFGKLCDTPQETAVPSNIAGLIPDTSRTLRQLDIWNTAEPLKTDDELDAYIRDNRVVSKCGAWVSGTAILQFFVSMDMVLCCPASLPTFPSLSNILNLLTRCEDKRCIECYGGKVHVNSLCGHTAPESSCEITTTCPCLVSCGVSDECYMEVTGNKNLLGLLFDPVNQADVVGLRVMSYHPSTKLSNILCGVTSSGKDVPCTDANWQLLAHSAFVTRVFIYNCQNLKEVCLRSC